MTDRHPLDCLLTPPDAAIAIGGWAADWEPGIFANAPVLDPFAGAGTLLEWAFGGLDICERPQVHAWDLDPRWGDELSRRVTPFNTRLGRDSLAMDWMVRGERPHILTNPPYRLAHQAIAHASSYARDHGRWVCMLLRTDVWQHPLPPLNQCADYYLSLRWRPSYGLNRHGRMGSDSSGSQWCVWSPEPARGPQRLLSFLARPEVPPELRAEHRRLARIAYQMGHEAPGE